MAKHESMRPAAGKRAHAVGRIRSCVAAQIGLDYGDAAETEALFLSKAPQSLAHLQKSTSLLQNVVFNAPCDPNAILG